jgi:hypothetical protein
MNKENLYEPNCIRTYTGIYFNVAEPTIDMICIEDIAHALCNMPRFGGHLSSFYSVAQHSIQVSRMLSHEDKLAGLLHDASEAYLMDIPTPIKNMMPFYKEKEYEIMKLIAEKFEFDYPLNAAVLDADKQMLETEWKNLFLEGFDVAQPIREIKRIFLNCYKSCILYYNSVQSSRRMTGSSWSRRSFI